MKLRKQLVTSSFPHQSNCYVRMCRLLVLNFKNKSYLRKRSRRHGFELKMSCLLAKMISGIKLVLPFSLKLYTIVETAVVSGPVPIGT